MTRPAVRDDLRFLEGYHSPQVHVEVRLNTNESPEPPPAAWSEALAAALGEVAWHRYPDRAATALREAVGGLHGVGPEQVFAANGSNEVLQTLLLAYAGPGRSVATFEPTYHLHGHIARLTGATVIEGERREDFSLDLAEVERVLALGPSVVFLCSPNNPTGMVEPRAVVEHVLATMPDGALLVVDEAYGQFSDWTALDLVHPDRNLVVSRTFSKTWSMAAARLGYLVGPPWLVAELDTVVLPYHLDTAKQIAGRLAVGFVADMEARVQAVVHERERLVGALRQLGVQVWPSGANFVLFRPSVDAHRVWDGLVARSVLVRNCASWPRLAGCLRVTVGAPQENDAFLVALAATLEDLA